jgi:hypothetical protein
MNDPRVDRFHEALEYIQNLPVPIVRDDQMLMKLFEASYYIEANKKMFIHYDEVKFFKDAKEGVYLELANVIKTFSDIADKHNIVDCICTLLLLKLGITPTEDGITTEQEEQMMRQIETYRKLAAYKYRDEFPLKK